MIQKHFNIISKLPSNITLKKQIAFWIFEKKKHNNNNDNSNKEPYMVEHWCFWLRDT